MFSRSRYLPLCTILTACGGAAAGAQQPAAPAAEGLTRAHMYEVAPEQVARARQEAGIVEVTGFGSVSVSPDRAVVSFAVETREESAGAAANGNAETMDAVLTALRSAGFAGLTLETHGYSLQPEYGTIEEGNRRVRVIEGYAALNNVRAGLEDMDAVGRVIDVAIGAGANRVAGLSFVASHTEAARLEALAAAVEQARGEAATIAAALGHELGAVLEVRGGSALPRARPNVMMRAEGVAAVTPIEAADQVVTATVTVKFALGPPGGGG
jgi:uncharacterized protein YggE